MSCGGDCNCKQELNKQLQGLSARLSQAENNITSQFYATSMAIQGLLANPLTAGSVSPVAVIYNLTDVGFKALQGLISQLSPANFKKHMMAMAVGLLDGMALELESVASLALQTIEDSIASVESLINSQLQTIESISTSLANAKLNGNDLLIGTLQNQYDVAISTLEGLTGQKGKLLDSKSNLGGFMGAQSDIAKCKSTSFILNQ